jgi:outer membrane protein, multidrug efflux system
VAVVKAPTSSLCLATLIVAAALGGCAVGPDYHLPKYATFNARDAQGPFVGAKKNARVADAPLPPQWWRLYSSPNLDRLVLGALEANTDLRVAEANLQCSRALVELAKTQQQPNVTFDAGVERTQYSAEQFLFLGTLPQFTLYDVNLTASYEVDLFGRIRRGIEASEADDAAVEAARDWVRVAVAANVARAYADVCGAGDELTIARASLALQQESLAFTRRLFLDGRATHLDMSRSQTLVDQLRAMIPAFVARQRNALYRLATLNGKPPEQFEPRLANCVVTPNVKRLIPVGNGATLLRRRPDVRAAERELAAATAEIGVEMATLYPTVILGASVGSTGVTQDFLTQRTNDFAVGPGVPWQLSQNPARTRIAAATAAQKAQLAHFDGIVLGALQDVESALNVYKHDLEIKKSLTRACDSAAAALFDARRLQVDGRTDALSTLDAERTLAATNAALAAIRSRIAQDQVNLFFALGGGWEDAPTSIDISAVASDHN